MKTKSESMDGWLFFDNHRFANGQLKVPVNMDEIINNFKRQYGVYDLSLLQRSLAGMGTIVVNIAALAVFFNSLSQFLSWPVTFLDILEKGLLVFMIALLLLTVYVSGVLFLRLLFPRKRKIHTIPELLLGRGVLIQGRIIDSRSSDVQNTEFIYEFKNPANLSVTGRYLCKTMPTSIFHATVEQGIVIRDEVMKNLPHPQPKDVTVWYLNDKVHTLL